MTANAGSGELGDSANLDLDKWAQGDVLDLSEYFHASKLLETSPGEAAGFLLDVVRSNVHAMMITTQTCDVVRSRTDRPYVEVSPIVQSTDQDLIARAQDGKSIQFAATPWYQPGSLVDLDRSMTLDKTVLTFFEKSSPSPNKNELKKLQAIIARRYSRFAFPDDFSESMSKFREKLASKHGRQSPEGQLLRSVSQVRVVADPNWDAEEYEVTFYFIVPRSVLPALPRTLEESKELTDAKVWTAARSRTSAEIAQRLEQVSDSQARNHLWVALVEKWMEYIKTVGRLADVFAEVTTEDEFVMRDYWNSEALDFDYLSGPRVNQFASERPLRTGVRSGQLEEGNRRFPLLGRLLRRIGRRRGTSA